MNKNDYEQNNAIILAAKYGIDAFGWVMLIP